MDGDEYIVVWDPRLQFDYNEAPMEYDKASRLPEDVDDEEVVRLLAIANIID